MKVLQSAEKRDKLETTEDGWLICPICKRNRRLLKLRPDSEGQHLAVYCRFCKNEIPVDVEKGKGFQGKGR